MITGNAKKKKKKKEKKHLPCMSKYRKMPKEKKRTIKNERTTVHVPFLPLDV
jgi:hypothetical protein